MASAVCIRCSIWVRSVSGSLSLTSVLRNSIASQIPIVRRVFGRILPLLGEDEFQGLVAVIEPVELAHGRADVIAVVAEGRRLPRLGIPLLEERFPLVHSRERTGFRPP